MFLYADVQGRSRETDCVAIYSDPLQETCRVRRLPFKGLHRGIWAPVEGS